MSAARDATPAVVVVATAVAAQAAVAVAVAVAVETTDMAAAVTAAVGRPVEEAVVVVDARHTPEADPLPAQRAAAPAWVVRAPLLVLREAQAAAGRVGPSARTQTLEAAAWLRQTAPSSAVASADRALRLPGHPDFGPLHGPGIEHLQPPGQ